MSELQLRVRGKPKRVLQLAAPWRLASLGRVRVRLRLGLQQPRLRSLSRVLQRKAPVRLRLAQHLVQLMQLGELPKVQARLSLVLVRAAEQLPVPAGTVQAKPRLGLPRAALPLLVLLGKARVRFQLASQLRKLSRLAALFKVLGKPWLAQHLVALYMSAVAIPMATYTATLMTAAPQRKALVRLGRAPLPLLMLR